MSHLCTVRRGAIEAAGTSVPFSQALVVVTTPPATVEKDVSYITDDSFRLLMSQVISDKMGL